MAPGEPTWPRYGCPACGSDQTSTAPTPPSASTPTRAPSIGITAANPFNTGIPATLVLTITLIGPAHLTVDFGDGQQQDVGTLNAGDNHVKIAHTYQHAGQFTFTASVTANGATGTAAFPVRVM